MAFPIARDIFPKIAAHMKEREITLITGSRQVGKTILMNQLKEYLIQKKNIPGDKIFFYNLDLIRDESLFENQGDFIDHLKEKVILHKKIYVFIDEAQKVPDASRFFKGVYDSNLPVKFILSGSSSLEIKAKLKESLAGRKKLFKIMPFSFTEYLRHQDPDLAKLLDEKRKVTTISQKKMIKHYEEYLVFGGYPRVVLAKTKSEKIDVLEEIYSSYLQKDVFGFLPIKNKTAFNRLIQLLAAQAGQLVNLAELTTHLGINRLTVESYLHILEETFIIKKLGPYFKNPRQEIIKANKIYFLDNGIRHFALENFQAFEKRLDKGAVMENGCFIHLLHQKTHLFRLYFWRTKQGAEVDFVMEKTDSFLPIEVKASFKKKTLPRGLASFIQHFSPKKAVIINLNSEQSESMVGQTQLKTYLPFDFFGV